MTDEELRVRAIQELEFYKKDDTFMLADITVDLAIETLEQEPCDNAVSRQDVLDLAKKGILVSNGNYESVCKAINELPSVNPQPKTEQFAKWVATEIFDENWEYNKDAFDELACRKLAKLGIVRAKGDEWELLEPQESNDKCKNCEYYRNPDYTRCHECKAERSDKK